MIYFIRSGNIVKIGYSADPLKRLKQLQTGNPTKLKIMATMPGLLSTEKALHDAYAKYRVRDSEWFSFENKNSLFWSIVLLKDQNEGRRDERFPEIKDVSSFYAAGMQKYLSVKSKRHPDLKQKLTKYM